MTRDELLERIADDLVDRRNRGPGRGEGAVTTNRATALEAALRALEVLEALGALPSDDAV